MKGTDPFALCDGDMGGISLDLWRFLSRCGDQFWIIGGSDTTHIKGGHMDHSQGGVVCVDEGDDPFILGKEARHVFHVG